MTHGQGSNRVLPVFLFERRKATLMRRLRLFLLILTVMAGVAIAGIKLYLGSALATLRAAGRLSEAYGAAVELDRFDVGMDQTTFRGVRFFQVGDLPGDVPWLSIKEALTDLSFLDAPFDQPHY